MLKELERVLQIDYEYAIEAQKEDSRAANDALGKREMERYFDLSLYFQLADICWALEKWDEARYWYQHNAKIISEKCAWHIENSKNDYPIDAISDWEVNTLIRAGYLDFVKVHLERAIEYWRDQPNNQLVLAMLGLHAAQIGLNEKKTYIHAIVEARRELPGGSGEVIKKARELLHYEFAQRSLLLGLWNEFEVEVNKMQEGVELIQNSPELVFPHSIQNALIAAYNGFQALIVLKSGRSGAEESYQIAIKAFEEAMLGFYQFSGYVDSNLYFMRLNTLFACELKEKVPLNPNPFSDSYLDGN